MGTSSVNPSRVEREFHSLIRSPHRDIESRLGIHTYITLVAENDTCQISSCLNPEAFSQHF